MVIYLGGYDRISDDKEGLEKGVTRQNEDYTAVVEMRGMRIGRRYVDNDRSAYKRNVKRKDFERMLRDLWNGIIGGVAAYDLDRLFRQPRDLERLIDVYEAKPWLRFVTVTNDYDLSTPDGRTMARIMCAIANKSSADTARRVARKHRERAEEGLTPNGFAPYGWLEDNETVDPVAEAEILAAHVLILSGTRVGTIHRDWVNRGIHSSQMKARGATHISYQGVKHILTNWRLCGYRVHQGEVMRNDDDSPKIGKWGRITTPERLIAVRGVLAKNSRPKGAPKLNRALTYLLSGIAHCGKCGSRMRGSVKPHATEDATFNYSCVPSETDGARKGCGGTSRRGNPVDALVIEYLMREARKARTDKVLDVAWPRVKELAQCREDIRLLEEARDAEDPDERMPMRDFIKASNKESRRLAELETEYSAWETSQAIKSNTVNVDVGDWDLLTLEQQRHAVLQRIESVIIHPAGRGARKFNPDLIEIVPAKAAVPAPTRADDAVVAA